MVIGYLNHDTKNNTGAGRFYNSFVKAAKKMMPDLQAEVLTAENILYPNKLKLILALPAIKKILNRCDVIHALDGWPYGVVAALVNRKLNKPLIITAIGTGAVKPFYSWWRRPIMKWAYRQADKVVAVSSNTKKEIQKFLPDLEIEVINHGVDFNKFEIRNPKSGTNSKFEKFKPYILSVGAWKPRKGFDYSLKAFDAIRDKFPDLQYVIVGNPPQNIKEKYSRVIFLNNLPEDDLIALYKNAELFILLPQNDDKNVDIEGFGLVFLEAAAAGLPVIGTRDSGASDAVLDGKNGFLIPQKDHASAAHAIEKILMDKKMKEKFSAQSLKFAKEMSWERVATLYQKIYSKFINNE